MPCERQSLAGHSRFDAIVILPDHLHAIWTLPPGDADYSQRWGWIKKEFTKRWLALGEAEVSVSESKQKDRRHGVWQRRFSEHTIRDDDDYERHCDDIHYNPVKHRARPMPRRLAQLQLLTVRGRGILPSRLGL